MKNPFDLSDKVALVTGGNGGIGLGMAEGLAQQGASVVICGTNEAKNEDALSTLRAIHPRCDALKVDVGDETAVREAVAHTLTRFGRLDAAIGCAGVMQTYTPLFDIEDSRLEQTERINLHGVVYLFRHAARHMADRHGAGDPGGSLVSVSSIGAIMGTPGYFDYGMTKGGLTSLSRAFAVELAPYAIRVNAICPGWVRTGMTAGFQDWDEFDQKFLSRVPLQRWGTPSDLAGIAVYLTSDASAFHTGDTIVVDGGYTIF